ncbi:microcystin LR degradation protein MlrC-like protein [Achromobacter insolitus]|uniref:M81 family metallopeptidase n=1 Tax=Achromobacter insolitus TaxID=217204 RepID=UPI00083AF352|nr:M81 family metallopeptidase [Achromobacter insolitus]OCZ56375.1 microcystin LR degradation protein MlrC-like protein [Achromobacter insolitus]
MRIFTGALATETNTFSPLPTGLAAFKSREYLPAGTHPDHMTFYAGPLWAARQRAREMGWTLVEGLVASAQPGGTTTRAAYETLRDELLADLRAALPVDMVLLGLHGAMVADGYDDCEGDILRRVREIVGPDVVVGAELDPHAHLSPLMVQQATVLVLFKEYPHIDVLERAQDLLALCLDAQAGRTRPVAALVDCEMIVPMHTTREPAQGFVSRIKALEGRDGILSISAAQGFATGDVPEMGTKVLVYADGDAARAQALARQLADELIAMREQLMVPYRSVDQALDEALAFGDGPVVLADRSDNPGSGAAGDSTYLLARMRERGIRNAAIGPMWDPVAARIAFDAGPGAVLDLRIGGKVGPLSGSPVDARCRVVATHADMTMTGNSNTRIALGDCALVDVDGIVVALVSLRTQAYHTDLFTQLGCDLSAQRLIVVKSAHHFHAKYAPLAKAVLYVAAPGSASPDWRSLTYRKARLPKWPIA